MDSRVSGAAAPAPSRAGSVFPLRPMNQDEVFSSALAVLRHAPRAVIGLPVIASAVNFVLTTGLMLIAPTDTFLRLYTQPAAFEDDEVALAAFSDLWVLLLMSVTSFLSWVLLYVAAALIPVATLRAVYGLGTGPWQTLQITRKRLGWLVLHVVLVLVVLSTVFSVVMLIAALIVAFTLLVGVFVVVPAMLLGLLWTTVALMHAPVVIVVEGRDAITAVGRSFQLNKGLWVKHMVAVGVLFVVGLIVMLATMLPLGALLGISAGTVDGLPEDATWLTTSLLIGVQLTDSVLTALILALMGVVISVLYLNARFRQEALDTVLEAAADKPYSSDDAGDLVPGSPQHTAAYFSEARSPQAAVPAAPFAGGQRVRT
ncbi:hypothetical protein [Nesterenkonia alba]|uniref:hypothetical protein n=1 Tax=Nesterenkonia alba TaxID=515814 RepID=UPI0004919C60|nr:hypothetical protein [Nesterenkonia alba]